jgi:cytidine deaminase
MKKYPLNDRDRDLVKAAVDAIKQPVMQIGAVQEPSLVGSALRLKSGEVFTAQNMIVDVGSISMCAEPQAIAQANRVKDRQIESIVAVYFLPGQEPKVIPPCGRCREIITDFIGSGHVILRDPGSDELYKVSASDLLPLKYAMYWKGDELL